MRAINDLSYGRITQKDLLRRRSNARESKILSFLQPASLARPEFLVEMDVTAVLMRDGYFGDAKPQASDRGKSKG
jgi:hypothetical protein